MHILGRVVTVLKVSSPPILCIDTMNEKQHYTIARYLHETPG